MSEPIRPLWSPHVAGIVLGLVLVLTFILAGNGLGASGAFTRLTALVGMQIAPEAVQGNAYLGGMVAHGANPLAAWIVFMVVGVAIGGLLSALGAGRFRWQLDGAYRTGKLPRIALALGGGVLAGVGSRVASGCTSGIGLSGTAVLGVAGLVFVTAFFVVGPVVSHLIRRSV